MKKQLLCVIFPFVISGCSGVIDKQLPVCDAVANIGGQKSTVQIYGVRKEAGQTQYMAGYPFNWRWINKNNFISTTCN
ncbi:phage exclusion lipoprotein Cor [Klebsiella pneumoniae]|uniref:phage exclusion lipoprotein Cor n=1 Tax=Enterobacteriaceae TaxID=543 RepID=UPI0008FB44C2|nr:MULTISPECIES: cor protein [Enterobacteriaceae]ATM51320.1 cor protein [Klebsiella pneumoniae]AXZ62028.1 cor protein [Klebsiella pneumoniae]AXZ62033.1 cor protein [Klebsiella pneumoniae]AZH95989.1 cor protein [Klebsiella pneumoniae]EIV9761138.1 cor protein [Klebsiella pneumoniae]